MNYAKMISQELDYLINKYEIKDVTRFAMKMEDGVANDNWRCRN